MQAGEDSEAYFNSMPAGYYFDPTDEELIERYLKKKIRNEALPVNRIFEVDLYDNDPVSLTGRHKLVRSEGWYFFTRRVKKYPNGCRPRRGAGDGYWKPTGTDVAIPEGNPQGYRKSLDYYFGKHPNGRKTNWKMHEFRLRDASAPDPSSSRGSDPDSNVLGNWVLCKVYKKKEKGNTDAVDRNVEANPSLTTADPLPEYQNGFISENGAAVNGATKAKLLHSDDTRAYVLPECGNSSVPPNGAGSSNPQQYYFHGSTSGNTTSNDMSNNYSYEGQPLNNGWGHDGNPATMKDITHMAAPNETGSSNPQQYYFHGSTSANTDNYSYCEGQPLNNGWEYAGINMNMATMEEMSLMAAPNGAGSSNPQQYYFHGFTSTDTTSNDMANNHSYYERQPLNNGWGYAGDNMDLATMKEMTLMAAPNGAGSSNPQQYYFHGSTSTNTISNDKSNNYSHYQGQPLNNGRGYAGDNMDLATMKEMNLMAAPNEAGCSSLQKYYFHGSTSTNTISNDKSNNYSSYQGQPLNNGRGYAGDNMDLATMKEMNLMAAPNEAGCSSLQKYKYGSTSTETASNDMSNNYSYEGQTLNSGWGHAGNNMNLATLNDITSMAAPNALMACSTVGTNPEMENHATLDGLASSSDPLMFLSLPEVDSWLRTPENESHCREAGSMEDRQGSSH